MNKKYIWCLLSLGLLVLFSCKKDEFSQPDWAYFDVTLDGNSKKFDRWEAYYNRNDTNLINISNSIHYVENKQRAEYFYIGLKLPVNIDSTIIFDTSYFSDTTNILWQILTGHGDAGGPEYDPDTTRPDQNFIIIRELSRKYQTISGEFACNFIKRVDSQIEDYKSYPDSFHVEGKFKMPLIKY